MTFVANLIEASLYGFGFIFAGLAVMIFVPRALSKRDISVGSIRLIRALGGMLTIPGFMYLALAIAMLFRIFIFVTHSN